MTLDDPNPFEPPHDPELLDDDKFDIDEHAEILAAKATKGYCQAIYWDGKYVGQTYDSHELIFGLIDRDDYPSAEIFDAVHDAACAIIDDWGGPWMTEEDYAALTGRDEPPDLPNKDLTDDLLAQTQLKLPF